MSEAVRPTVASAAAVRDAPALVSESVTSGDAVVITPPLTMTTSPLTMSKEERASRVARLREFISATKKDPKRSRKRGIFVFYGDPGTGKSEQAAHCFQRSFHLITSPSVTKFYESRVHRNFYPDTRVLPVKQHPMPKYKMEVTGDKATRVRVNTSEVMVNSVLAVAEQAAVLRAQGRPLKYWNFVIDELGAAYNRIYQQLYESTYSAERAKRHEHPYDSRTAFRLMKEWSAEFFDTLAILPVLGLNVCAVAHEREADIKEGHRGGPLLVSKSTITDATGFADGALRRYLKNDLTGWAHRRWACYNSEWQTSKLRGMEPEDCLVLDDFYADDILTASGYEANYLNDEDCATWKLA